MPEPLTITCPSCRTKLKIKDRNVVGKKLTCPKCKKPVVVKAPAQDEDEFDRGDGSGDDDEFARPAPPPRAAKVGKKSSSAKKSAPGSSKAPLLIGGGVAVLLLLGGVAATLWWLGIFSGRQQPEVAAAAAAPAGAAANRMPLEFLPPASELFIAVRVADLWSAPLVQSWADTPQVKESLQHLQQEMGLTPADIESLTVGVAGLSERAAAQGQMPGLLQGLSMLATLDAVAVARFKKPVDASSLKIKESGAVAVDHQGKTYFRGPTAPGDENPVAVYLAGPTMAVIGPEPAVKLAIERGEKAADRPDLAFADVSHHVLIAAVPQDRAALAKLDPTAGAQQSKLDRLLYEKVRGFSVGLKITGGAAVELALECADSASAGQVREEFNNSLSEARQTFASAKEQLPPAIAQLGEVFMNSLSAAGENTTIRVAGAVPDSAQQQLAALPGQLMGMFMAQILAAGAGPLPGGPTDDPPIGADTSEEMGSIGPQESLLTEGVPGDMHVAAHVEWSHDTGLDPAGQPLPPRLEVAVEITGGEDEIAQYGMYRIDEVVTADGQTLVYHEQPGGEGPTKQFLRYVADDALSRHPDDGIRATFVFEHPATPLRTITRFSGAVLLRVPEETTTVTLKNIMARVGKAVEHSQLKKAGIQFKLVKEDFFMALKLMSGDLDLIGDIVPVEKDGTPIPGYRFIPSTSIKDGKKQFQWVPQDEFPKDMGLEVTLYSDLSEVSVPFRFAGLNVPPPPKPGEAVLSGGAPPAKPGRPPSLPPKGPREVIKVTADEILGDYVADEKQARTKYSGKSVEVTGKVKSVQRGNDQSITIILSDSNDRKLIVCEGFTKSGAVDQKVKEGQTVTLFAHAVLTGSSDYVALSDCELVEGK